MHGIASTVLLCASLVIASSSNSTSLVDLGYVEVSGSINTTLSTITYWGLPFAQAPTGDLRWRAPVPIEASRDDTYKQVFNATQPGAQCVQGPPVWQLALAGTAALIAPAEPAPVRPSSEDCLLLDVIIPQQAKSGLLPVVVQIHGGVECFHTRPLSGLANLVIGYTEGNSDSSDGHPFVAYSNGSVVWVQIQYRLGAYGFLGGTEVDQSGDTNVGLLDQRLALEWVQNHIRSFGGDPTQVTIWGGSAGGGSVTNQLIAFGGEANPPFRAAIAEYPWWQPFHDKETLTSQYEVLLSATNCTDIVCMRNLDYDALANATMKSYIDAYSSGLYGYGDFYYGPYVDGKFIQDLPSEEFGQGRWSKVPLLLDHDAFEGLIFTNASITTSSETVATLETVFQANDPAIIARFQQFNEFFSNPIYQEFAAPNALNLTEQDTEYWRLQTAIGNIFINCGTYYAGLAAGNSAVPAWKLVFNAGIYVHAATSSYLFSESSRTANATLADIMKGYFWSFIVNLDPNSGPDGTSSSRQFWPQYASNSTNNFRILQINETSIGVQDDGDVSDRCDFWNSQGLFVKN
ncbi:alpha/beta-hydrolase [Lophiostoma macrostomum CBS 122681]|uniref:Carboxylic ester hydrolase n=1 Tax=Lophiostoma macrostomum CBS 122681 TaxID=1314788 RepID=A0A6A6SZI3_9PLEO|nr:alpha/beta-hydrolase [Lophiostoma macrostomum CBS 122681]